ncbi:MAG: rRNA (cytosine1402-N4)-methyltransferase [Candidatus Sumerlaeota bacterium]|nr:rRNA (cytosine1402-N4)-methyltransferase [Candidatus Sumerlaeota bacterium]
MTKPNRPRTGKGPGANTVQYHEPVFVAEVMKRLRPQPGAIFCDGTIGSAGHGSLIVSALGGRGTFIGLDRDPAMLERARTRLEGMQEANGVRLILEAAKYEELPAILKREGLTGVNGILLDLGINSLHVAHDAAERGFSFSHDGPLDGRFNPNEPGTQSVESLVNNAAEADIARWLFEYADERFARAIARRIVRERAVQPIRTTRQLAEIVALCYPPKLRHGSLHPATRTFQTFRIVANDELGCVERGIRACIESLLPGGTCVVLSYHSGEDRITKRLFDEYGSPRPDPSNLYSATTTKGLEYRVEKRGALKPSDAEIASNPRARSARLRAITRLEVAA